jgi:mannitol 2-dehydrogenase
LSSSANPQRSRSPHGEVSPPVSLVSSADARVARPSYDRTAVTTGIAHFGVGGFFRSHQAMCLDRLMDRGLALD